MPKTAAAPAATEAEADAAERHPRVIVDELAQLEADAMASCTPMTPEKRTALHVEFMRAVCGILEAWEA